MRDRLVRATVRASKLIDASAPFASSGSDDASPAPPAPAPEGGSRKARRRNAAFVRRLQKRLAKDGTPVTVKQNPDGGLHVHVDTRPEKKAEG